MSMLMLLTSLITPSWAGDLVSMARPAESDEWGYIDASGSMVIDAKYRKIFPFSEDGFAPIYAKKRKTWVFLDPSGKELDVEPDPLILKSIMGFGALGFSDQRAPFRDKKSKKYGYIDTSGKVVIEPMYDDVNAFDGGYATVEKDDAWMVIDTSGAETRIAADAVDVKPFTEGRAPTKTSDGLTGFIDKNGKLVVKPVYKSVGYFTEGLAWAKTPEGMVGFIDPSGSWVIKPVYVAAKDFGNGLARVKSEGTDWMFVKADGTLAKFGHGADTVKDFSEGLARAKKDGMFGFIDTSGEWVIEPAYDNARDFKNGYAAARQGDRWGFVDPTGKWVVKPVFDVVRDFESTGG